MKKIVIIPGVGYQKDTSKAKELGKNIQERFNCEYEVFNWDHTGVKIFESRTIAAKNLAFKPLRDFLIEAILDFEYALKYMEDIDVPVADYYIGHSAGSFFAMAQNKPSTIMGSPFAIIKYMPKGTVERSRVIAKMMNNRELVLNLINEYDVLAYPVEEPIVDNVCFKGGFFNPLTYFPLTAHTGYWTNKFVEDNIVKHLKCIFK